MEQPQYFGVIEHYPFPDVSTLKSFSFLSRLNNLTAIVFAVRDVANPGLESIGLFYMGGTRRYIWRERYWLDYDAPNGLLMSAIALKIHDTNEIEALKWRKILDVLKSHAVESGPTLHDYGDTASNRHFYRIIYEVNE